MMYLWLCFVSQVSGTILVMNADELEREKKRTEEKKAIEAEIQAIRDKPESERTHAEKEALKKYYIRKAAGDYSDSEFSDAGSHFEEGEGGPPISQTKSIN